MKTSRIADEDSVSKEIKYIHTYIHTYYSYQHVKVQHNEVKVLIHFIANEFKPYSTSLLEPSSLMKATRN